MHGSQSRLPQVFLECWACRHWPPRCAGLATEVKNAAWQVILDAAGTIPGHERQDQSTASCRSLFATQRCSRHLQQRTRKFLLLTQERTLPQCAQCFTCFLNKHGPAVSRQQWLPGRPRRWSETLLNTVVTSLGNGRMGSQCLAWAVPNYGQLLRQHKPPPRFSETSSRKSRL